MLGLYIEGENYTGQETKKFIISSMSRDKLVDFLKSQRYVKFEEDEDFEGNIIQPKDNTTLTLELPSLGFVDYSIYSYYFLIEELPII